MTYPVLQYRIQSLGDDFQSAVRQLEQTNNITIELLDPLAGGKSGALLYLVAVTSVTGIVGHFILKLDHQSHHTIDTENTRYAAAMQKMTREFYETHMVTMPFRPAAVSGTTATLYTIAGDTLQRYRPVSSYSQQQELEIIFNKVTEGLLHEWNNHLAFALTHPQQILQNWLRHRTSRDTSNIDKFLQEDCGTDPDVPRWIAEDYVLPNPLLYVREADRWGERASLNAARGTSHGDLNTSNVLVRFSRDQQELENFYLIDFAMFEEHSYLFYDNAYLEVSYLVGQVNQTSVASWVKFVTQLAKSDIPNPQRAPDRLSGPCAVIATARERFNKWVMTSHSTIQDHLWGQFLLAAVASGLNFCNKAKLEREERFAALIYAAAHLKEYCERFGIRMQGEAVELNLVDPLRMSPGDEWEPFLDACHNFDTNRLLVLVTNRHSTDPAILSSLGRVGWSLVLDLDPDTLESGLCKFASNEIKGRRALHVISMNEEVSFQATRATYWYAARGLRSRRETLPRADTYLEWRRMYDRQIEDLLISFVRASREARFTVVGLWNNKDEAKYALKVYELLDQTLGERADYVFACPDIETVLELTREYPEVKGFSIQAAQVAAGLRSLLSAARQGEGDALFPVVTSPEEQEGGRPAEIKSVAIPAEDVRWLEEEFTLVHLGVGIDQGDSAYGRPYLRGNQISWFELALGIDVARNKRPELEERIRADLERRAVSRFYLYHYPGAGGTTIALRIAWNVHRTYPTVVLHSISNETIPRLNKLVDYGLRQILVIVEAANVVPDMLEILFRQARNEHLPVVFLTVQRRFDSVLESERTRYLRELLDQDEANYFAEVYSAEVPERRPALMRLAQTADRLHSRVPFYFGLTAFEKDFIQLEPYVFTRLQGMSSIERRVMLYLALAYQYAQKGLPPEIFSNIIGVMGSSSIYIENALRPQRLQLLVREREGDWRPAHNLIANEILEQILMAHAETREAWKLNLADSVIDMISDFAALQFASNKTQSEFVLDLLYRLLILRDSRLELHDQGERPRFARLIEDIPSEEGRLRVLQTLTDCFKKEPHFEAHLGRLYSYQKNYEKAIVHATAAVAASPEDNVLHHIEGVILWHWVRYLTHIVERKIRRGSRPTGAEQQEIFDLVQQAEDAFSKAQSLAPEEEYSYVSHIQLLVDAVEFGYKLSEKETYAEFLASVESAIYQDMVERAEQLLIELRSLHEGRQLSTWVEICEGQVNTFYENYSLLLKHWHALLDREDVYRPPVRRRLVHIYLQRSKRSWDNMLPDDLKRVAGLMKKNLREEPDRDWNVRLWFQAARRLPGTNIDDALELLKYWYSRSHSLEVIYQLYMLLTVKAIDGSDQARLAVEQLLKEGKEKSMKLPNSTFAFDWMGEGEELTRLVHFSRLGEFDRERGFYPNESLLVRVPGTVAKINTGQSGWLELKCGLTAFFVPHERRRAGSVQFVDRDINREVEFYLGFSYEGLRAWSVTPKA